MTEEKGTQSRKRKKWKKDKKKFRHTTSLLENWTTWPAERTTNLVWTWISITCWVVKSSLVKLGVMVCDKRHITSTPLWTPSRSSHTWLGGTGKTPAGQVFWSIFPINFTKQKNKPGLFMTYHEMNPRKSSIMDRVELNKRQLDCTYTSTQKF